TDDLTADVVLAVTTPIRAVFQLRNATTARQTIADTMVDLAAELARARPLTFRQASTDESKSQICELTLGGVIDLELRIVRRRSPKPPGGSASPTTSAPIAKPGPNFHITCSPRLSVRQRELH